MVGKDKLIELLAKAVFSGLDGLPDSEYYEKEDKISWVWEECTDEEQERVKLLRGQMNEVLKIHRKFKKEETEKCK